MSVLKNFVKDNSKFVKLQRDEPVALRIINYAPSTTQDGTPCVLYKVVVEGEMKEKSLRSASIGLASQIAELPNEGKGQFVEILKEGEGFNTTYTVTLLDTNRAI